MINMISMLWGIVILLSIFLFLLLLIRGEEFKKEGKILAVLAMFLLALSVVKFNFIIITEDVSIEENVWFISGKQSTYLKGSYVLLNIDDERISYKKIIKQVACVEGDKVRISNEIVYCNDTAIGRLLKEDKQGKPLYPFTQESEVTIPKDYYFVVGTDIRSYDSRYFGLVDFNRIITEVKPIL